MKTRIEIKAVDNVHISHFAPSFDKFRFPFFISYLHKLFTIKIREY